MSSADTHPDVAQLQHACISSASMSERATMVVEMSELVHELAMVGIRRRRPGISRRELRVEFIRVLHGDELAAAVASQVESR